MADEKNKDAGKQAERRPQKARGKPSRRATRNPGGGEDRREAEGTQVHGGRRPTRRGASQPKAKADAPKAEAQGEAGHAPQGASRQDSRARRRKAEGRCGEAAAAEQERAEKAPAPKAQRAQARRRARSRPVVRARAKYVRSSARKARLVMEHVRGRSVADARAVLRHTPRGVARDVARLLDSAVANAENNHDLVGDDLYVKEIYADEGPTLRRFRPRAQGRATRIRKRTSHLTVSLTTKE